MTSLTLEASIDPKPVVGDPRVQCTFFVLVNEGQIPCGPLKTIAFLKSLCGIYSLINSDLYHFICNYCV